MPSNFFGRSPGSSPSQAQTSASVAAPAATTDTLNHLRPSFGQYRQASAQSVRSTTSSQRAQTRAAIQERTSCLFRKLVGKSIEHSRDTYVSDAPQQSPARREANSRISALRQGGTPRQEGANPYHPQFSSSVSYSYNSSGGQYGFPETVQEGSAFFSSVSAATAASNQNNKQNRRWKFFKDPIFRRAHFARILYSNFWRIFMMILTFILLFGAQIRYILVPPTGDPAFDGIFLLAFLFFTSDIIMRIDVEPCYFVIQLGDFFSCNVRRDDSSSNNSRSNQPSPTNKIQTKQQQQSLQTQQQRQHQIPEYRQQGLGTSTGSIERFQIGSFLFWCDVVSTLALLHEISFIHQGNFKAIVLEIALDNFGIPQQGSGFGAFTRKYPIETQIDLFVTIAKTARVARFIRSTTAVKISSKVNWFWYLNALDPFQLWSNVKRSLFGHKRNNKQNVSNNQNQKDRSHLNASELSEGFTAFNPNNMPHSGSSADKSLLQESLLSFGSSLANSRGALGSGWQKILRALYLIHTDDSETSKEALMNKMAIRIQRAWRRSRTASRTADESMKGGRLAFDGSSTAGAAGRGTRGKGNDTPSDPNGNGSVNCRTSKIIRFGGSVVNATTTKKRNESQVGTAMRELTGQRVAIGIIMALAMTAFFTYTENDATRALSMIVLHNQTANEKYYRQSLDGARASAIPDLYYYQRSNGQILTWERKESGRHPYYLRPREQYVVSVLGPYGNATIGKFSFKSERQQEAFVGFICTLFMLFIWAFGVTAFSGPIMVLVVVPIERMVRLLNMLQENNVGYEDTPRFKRFMEEEDSISKNTNWTKEVLKGMETSFLTSTILRIGSLMKVGFGSAGVEIVRKNLQKGHKLNVLDLNSEGSKVYCIFLFCDIRQFTDATECLQEEVFCFTNRIAAVVHSYCHSYGGSANKNIGDAFLCTWLLDEDVKCFGAFDSEDGNLKANDSQADKALFTVVKICLALDFDNFYLEALSEQARDALLTKFSKRKGPVVRMGFGLHAGQAVQGAIGSQRKIDATYVSEHVNQAEELESWTKTYDLNLLMSDAFYRLLDASTRRRCRKVDQIMLQKDDEEFEDGYDSESGEVMKLYTFDMDIKGKLKTRNKGDNGYESDSDITDKLSSKRDSSRRGRRKSVNRHIGTKVEQSDELSEAFGVSQRGGDDEMKEEPSAPQELVLPNGPALYNSNVWFSSDVKAIREKYTNGNFGDGHFGGLFFQTFSSGLQSFYNKDWEHAKQCFERILKHFDDGPSFYFLKQMKENNGVPPRNFRPYGKASK